MISSILPAILPTVGKLVDKIFPDEEAAKRKKLKIEQELLKQLQSAEVSPPNGTRQMNQKGCFIKTYSSNSFERGIR